MHHKGFTLLELLVVFAVIAILLGISVPSYEAFKRRASKAVCISQMRVIHVALDNYVAENRQWPQMPQGVFDSTDESEYWKWWILTLDPYGAGEPFWLCPADSVRKESKDEYNGSYLPTKFDGHHFTPYRWASQPWLIERGDMHKKGAHIMLPDGSIHESKAVF